MTRKVLEHTWQARPARHNPVDAALTERLLEEMSSAWQRGAHCRVEEVLVRHPELGVQPDVVLRLVYHELCLRRNVGEDPSDDEYLQRFPHLHSKLARFFAHDAELHDTVFPSLGEDWGDYHIVAELGRGAQGRVYLGLQQSLATRPQVLKISHCHGSEHLSLARLQHTNIMPLYAAHYDPVKALRTLCMPYFGGAPLSRLLDGLHELAPWKRTGQDLLDIIDRAQEKAALPLAQTGPARFFLARASYVQAVCWIGASIADALDHAHERGLVHLDVKPDNVLIAGDGQPMLLDFHLAQAPLRHDGPPPEQLGGTVHYLSPEQAEAFAAVRDQRPVPADIDGRSDIFSLGLLLYEALGWALPDDRAMERGWLHRLNPHVSVGLSDIIARCLETKPADRYARASELAEDLRCHLGDRPLRGVRNRSLAERWQKWRRRRPQALALAAMLLFVVIAAISSSLLFVQRQRERLQDAQSARREADELFARRAYNESTLAAERGLTRLSGWPSNAELAKDLGRQRRRSQRAQAAADLHELAERIRFHYGADGLHAKLLQSLERSCWLAWDKREQLLPADADSSAGLLDPEVERLVRADLLDLALLGADFAVQRAALPPSLSGTGEGGEGERARRQALVRLTEAESAFGASPVLHLERRKHAAALGLEELARTAARNMAERPPRTAWEHELMGRSLVRARVYDEAAAHLRSSLELQPGRFWSHFYLGICAYRQQKYDEALLAYQACVALAPRVPHCFYNRGRVFAALERPEQAMRDYERALDIDANLAEAVFNRGLLHYQARRYREAASDFQHALASGADPAAGHYHLALVYLAQNKYPAAIAEARLTLQHNPEHPHAQDLLHRLGKEVPYDRPE